MSQHSTIHFLGGTESVTGSNFLLDGGGARFLVDCGLFQGEHSFDDTNWQPFQFDPSGISALIVTHAHIDHVGRIPKLVKEGYTGRIISTEATKALAEPMLLDAMELSRKTAKKIGKEPLYDERDIEQAMRQWDTVFYHAPLELPDGFSLELFNSGHILGSAMAKFSRGERSVVFTGDLGGGNSPLLPLCEDPAPTNYLVMESVYGDRVRHDDADERMDALVDAVERVARTRGVLLIPAFATERTQDLVYEIRQLMTGGRAPSMPVYLDSPLAEKVTQSYELHPNYFNEEMQERMKKGEKLFEFPQLHFVHDAQESAQLAGKPGPFVLIAGSGMSNGGRVVRHEEALLSRQDTVLLIVGYQAAGSLGRRLEEGAKSVNIRRTRVDVRASIEHVSSFSAHMDGAQLLEFARNAGRNAEHIFVVMGEPSASSFLAQRIREYAGLNATTPMAGSKAQLEL